MKTIFGKKSGILYTKGFTLLETLVAISILSVSVAAALSMGQKSLQSAYYSRDEATAYNLAAEGIELVRNVRDNDALSGNTWLASLATCLPANGGHCKIEPTTDAVSSCSGTCVKLNQTTAGLYTYSSGSASKFTRDIQVVQSSSAPSREATITVTITWSPGAYSNNPVKLTETMSNWH